MVKGAHFSEGFAGLLKNKQKKQTKGMITNALVGGQGTIFRLFYPSQNKRSDNCERCTLLKWVYWTLKKKKWKVITKFRGGG